MRRSIARRVSSPPCWPGAPPRSGISSSQATEDLDATLAGRAGEIGDALAGRVNEISLTLANRLSEIEGALGGRGADLQNALAERAKELRELFETRGRSLVASLSQRGGEIAEEMTNVGALVSQSIEGRGMAIVQRLGDTQNELTDAIERSAAHVREAFEVGAAESIGALIDANAKLGGEMTEVASRLVSGSAALQNSIGVAGANFAAVEQSLGDRMDDFRRLLGAVSSELERVNQAAGQTVFEASGLAETIAGHGETLSAAAGDLVRSQSELDQMLNARRASLDALLRAVNERRDDFENVMGSFATLIEDAFQNAESRAREIGSMMAETSQSAGGTIDQQFADIRANIATERERTAAAMRAAYEQANAEIDGIFSQGAQRFQTAASELRDDVAANSGRTRGDPGSLERQRLRSAAGDRAAGGLDAENRRRRDQGAEGAERHRDPLRAVPRHRDGDFQATVRRRRPRPRTPGAPAAAPRGADRRPKPRRRPRLLADARAAPRPDDPAAARRQGAPATERGGWLSDLLARASTDEPPAPARTMQGHRTEGRRAEAGASAASRSTRCLSTSPA